jgi:hypothetical protein
MKSRKSIVITLLLASLATGQSFPPPSNAPYGPSWQNSRLAASKGSLYNQIEAIIAGVLHATLADIVATDPAANEMLYWTAPGTSAALTTTAWGRSWLSTADEEAARVAMHLTVINVADYATGGTGTSGDPWSGGLAAAFAAHGGTCTYYLPSGYYHDATTVELHTASADGFITICGDGQGTHVVWNTADGTPGWELKTLDGSVLFWIEIKDLYFDGDNLATGPMIRVEDVSHLEIASVHVNDQRHDDGVGFAIYGRENVFIHDCQIHATTGLIVGENPNAAAIDADSWSIRDCAFLPADETLGYGILIEGDMLFNFTVDHCNFVRGHMGIYWDGTNADGTSGSAGDSWKPVIQGCKFENGNSADDYAIYFAGLAGTDNIQGPVIRDCMVGSGMSGFFLNSVLRPRIESCIIAGGAGNTSLECDDAGYQSLTLTDSYINTAATMSVNTGSTPILRLGDYTQGEWALGIWSTEDAVLVANRTFPEVESVFVNVPDDGDWDSEAVAIWQAPSDSTVTITSVYAAVMGDTTPSLVYNIEERAYNTPNTAGTDIYAADQAADASGEIEAAFSNAQLAANAYLVLTTGAGVETGNVTNLLVKIEYTRP